MDTEQFAICLDNRQHPAALERRKLYAVLADPIAEQQGLLRVIDESGEDYLYPAEQFVKITFSPDVVALLQQAA